MSSRSSEGQWTSVFSKGPSRSLYASKYIPLIVGPVLRDEKIVTLSKFKTFTDYKLNVTQNIKFVFFIEYKMSLEKEKILATSIFSFLPNVLESFFLRGIKSQLFVVKG